MLKHRIATGIAVCAVVFGVVFFLPGFLHFFLLFAIFGLAHAEWGALVRKAGFRFESVATRVCGALFLILAAMETPAGCAVLERSPLPVSLATAFGFYAVPVVLLALAVLRRRPDGALQSFALSYAGFWYVSGLLSFLVRLAFEFPSIPGRETNYTGRLLLLAFIVLVKTSDIGAYAAGRIWGRHKLVPSISPAKTVEGLAGGYALSLLSGLVLWAVFEYGFGDGRLGQLDFPLVHAVALPLLLTTTGVIGDLAESLVKRSAGAKDSSSRFPGMGGTLDIVDSLLFSAPFMYAYVVWFVK